MKTNPKSKNQDPTILRSPLSIATLSRALLLTLAALIVPASRCQAGHITMELFVAEYGECGAVTVNGYVITSEGVIERVQWDWGDGTTNDSWFPASHQYAANGSYQVQVTAFSSTAETHTETLGVTITNADGPTCTPITLSLGNPEYGSDGMVSINGSVSGADRLEWDWGDGQTNEGWLPGTHTYSDNGSYEVSVTAYATGRLPRTETVTALVTNALGGGVSHITLTLFEPDMGSCGEVSINGAVGTSAGWVERLDWDWGDGTTSRSFFPAPHTYTANGTYQVSVTAHGSEGSPRTESRTVIVDSVTPACANTFRVYPDMVFLKNGNTSQTLTIDLRRPGGHPIPFDPASVRYDYDRPDLVHVTPTGEVSSTGLGTAVIMVSLPGQPRSVKVVVVAGEIRVEPSIMLLSMDAPATGQVRLEARNADGSLVDLTGRSVVFSGGNDVASVDADGVVTPLRPPASFGETPYIRATLDGTPPCNACVVRVTENDLGLTMRDYVGEFVNFRVPDQIGPYPYQTLMTDLQVSEVLQAVFRMERRFCGTRPNAGGQQFIVIDPGVDADGTVPCGLSGNPIRIGVGVHNLRSCFGGPDWIHWGVMAHELAHNFLYQASFGDFVDGISNPGAYIEGLATAVGAFSIQEIIRHPDQHGLSSGTLASLNGQNLPLVPANIRHVHYPLLANYEANPDYANAFTADLVDAILLKLADEYGSDFFFRLMSVFYPPEEVAFGCADETQRLTFWVAACSAAARADLRARFRDTWGYPVDDTFYQQIFPRVAQRASQRDLVTKDWFATADEFHLISHAIPDTVYQLQSSSNLLDWHSIRTEVASGFAIEWVEPVDPGVKQNFLRVHQP